MFTFAVPARSSPPVLMPIEESRLKTTQEKFRFGLEDGKPLPKLKTLTYAEAIFEAMIHRFYEDPTMIAYGEENRDWGGAFARSFRHRARVTDQGPCD